MLRQQIYQCSHSEPLGGSSVLWSVYIFVKEPRRRPWRRKRFFTGHEEESRRRSKRNNNNTDCSLLIPKKRDPAFPEVIISFSLFEKNRGA